MQPETKYARSGDVNIAYQVVGDGPRDLVLVPGWLSNVEVFWEEPSVVRFFERLASFTRLILFDKRGTGLSDRVADIPNLETRMDDIRAALDAVRSPRAALFGYSEGGPMCALFAATYPDRTSALIASGSYARRIWAPDYPSGTPRQDSDDFIDAVGRGWGGPVGLASRAPSAMNDTRLVEWWARFLRMSGSPGAGSRCYGWPPTSTCGPCCRRSVCRRSSSTTSANARCRSRWDAISPNRSRARSTSSWTASTTCRGSATWMRSSTRSRSSSPVCATPPKSIACSRP